MAESDQLLLSLAAIIVLGIGAQYVAWRIKLPSILLLLGIGFVAGPVTGLMNPDEMFSAKLLFPLVSISVGIIMFEGGLSLNFEELKEIGSTLWCLLSIGVLATWGMVTCAGIWILKLEFPMALLLGSILVVTGPTVVGPMLRFIRPRGRVSAIAKWEGIIIDPIGAVLALLVFSAVSAPEAVDLTATMGRGLVQLAKTALVGSAVGVAAAWPTIVMLRKHWIPDFLHNPMMLMIVVGSFAASNLLQHESGLLAVTLLGMILANQKSVDVAHLIEFKENLRVLLISSLFVVLAARLSIEQIQSIGWSGLVFVLVIMVIVRPAAVFLSTLGSPLTLQERVFLSWLAPRGIVAASVASVFSLEMGTSGDILVPATFMVIVGTVATYGLTAGLLARKLGISSPDPQGLLVGSAHPGARAIARVLQEADVPVLLVDSNRFHTRTARLEGLPAHFGSILSERTMEHLELGGIGRFLALTSNDEVNSLAALQFSEIFGRSNVYQLPSCRTTKPGTNSADHKAYGRILFGEQVTYTSLDDRFAAGAVVKKTKLSKEFDFEEFQKLYGEDVVVFFVLSDTGKLSICTSDSQPNPKPGDSLISLVFPQDDPAPPNQDMPNE